jgi:hypothetical protein
MPTGIPKAGYRRVRPYVDRFLSMVLIDGDADCWIWQGGLNPKGYGTFCEKSKRVLAHRWAYSYWKGLIIPGFSVCHRCDNPRCVNPVHLWLGTPRDNSRDMVIKGRSRPGEERGQNKLTEAQVREIRQSYKPRIRSRATLAREYGVSIGAIQSVIERGSWRHI